MMSQESVILGAIRSTSINSLRTLRLGASRARTLGQSLHKATMGLQRLS